MIFPAGYCVRHETADIDEMRMYFAHWNLEQSQLGKGCFRGEVRGIHTENVQLGLTVRSTGVLLRGEAPRDCVALAMAYRAEAPIYYRGGALPDNQITALGYREEVELSSTGRTDFITVVVNTATLERQMSALLGRPLDHWRTHERMFMARPERMSWLKRLLLRYMDFAMASRIAGHPDGAQRLENGILEKLILHVGHPEIQLSRPQRLHLAKRAEEHLRAYADTPISISDLCETLGINQRTLFLGFSERYGISPKAYLTMLRLNGARRDLLNAEPHRSVTWVAMKWGFFHLGRFSIAYRSLFGEPPIATLKTGLRRPRQAGSVFEERQ